jgi:uncharacterized integral membrane protein (TIGR00698 family)
VLAAFALHALVPAAGALLLAMLAGVVAAPLVRSRPATAPGIRLAARELLRAGVALLGLRVSVGELGQVGPAGVVVAAGTVAVTLSGAVWAGRRLGVPPRLALLIAAGSAICGASAIAAMEPVARAREEHVGYAVATVTLLGTAGMLALPPAAAALGLSDLEAGMWAGASLHEVAQVAAAGAAVSAGALKLAALVKLVRVVLLAPVVAAMAAVHGTGRGSAGLPVPGFVLAFLALVAVRSVVAVPAAALDAALVASTVLLAAGLAALGLGVRFGALRAAGLRPLALGVLAAGLAAGASLALLLLLPA